MNYIRRIEVIKRITATHPEANVNTIHRYIDKGIIKHSKKMNGVKLFSVEYIDKIIACTKSVIDWKLVSKIEP